MLDAFLRICMIVKLAWCVRRKRIAWRAWCAHGDDKSGGLLVKSSARARL